MDVRLEGIFAHGSPYISVCIYSISVDTRHKQCHYVETMNKLLWLCRDAMGALSLRCVSAVIELPCHLGHAYIISYTLYTGFTAVVVGST